MLDNLLEKAKLLKANNNYQDYREALESIKRKLCFPDPEICL